MFHLEACSNPERDAKWEFSLTALSDKSRSTKPTGRKINHQTVKEDPKQLDFEDDGPFIGGDDENDPMSDPIPSSPVTKAVERKATANIKVEPDDDDDIMDTAQAVGHTDKVASVNMTGIRPPPKIKKEIYPSPESSSPPRATSDLVDISWNDVTSKLNVLSSPATEPYAFGKLSAKDAVEEDGSLRMFWTDYTEINGSFVSLWQSEKQANWHLC